MTQELFFQVVVISATVAAPPVVWLYLCLRRRTRKDIHERSQGVTVRANRSRVWPALSSFIDSNLLRERMTRDTASRINALMAVFLGGAIGFALSDIGPWWCGLALTVAGSGVAGYCLGVLFDKSWPEK